MYRKILTIMATAVLLVPSFAISATLLDNLQARKNLYGIMALEADGNGQTYFVHFAGGKKYYTGQVDGATGQAFADGGAWLGMTRADLATIPTASRVYEEVGGAIPDTYEIPARIVNQGLYDYCVAFSITRMAEHLTGKQYSVNQLYLDAGGTGGGLDALKALKATRDVGLIEEYANPFDATPWKRDDNWYLELENTEGERDRFNFRSVTGRYTGSEVQITAIKRAILESGHLTASIDTRKDWDNLAEHTGKFTPNHQILLSGWTDDGWIVNSSYGEGAGLMRYDYPMLWVYALSL